MPEIFVVESNMTGNEHTTVNSAFVEAVAGVAGRHGSGVTVFSGRSHAKALQREIGSGVAVRWVPIDVVPGLRRRFVRKCLVEIWQIVWILRRARKERARVLLLSIFPNTFFLLLLLRRWYHDVPVHVVLHTEIGSLEMKEKAAIHKQGFWVKHALFGLYRGDWPYLYVLGNGIRERFRREFPGSIPARVLRSLRHPFRFSMNHASISGATGPVRIGFIGGGRSAKGFGAFVQLAASFEQDGLCRKLQFVVVGGVNRTEYARLPGNVTVLAEQPAGLPAEHYVDEIRRLDCAVFLYTRSYNMVASGAVFDAINGNAEIFSLENEYFRDVAKDDVEGGMKFFHTSRDIESEIRRRIVSGEGFSKFGYPSIRSGYAADAVSQELEVLLSPIDAAFVQNP